MPYTDSEKHEIHCPKRYLEYQETPLYRAFRDKDNPESFRSNYAVLKTLLHAEESIAAVEEWYAGMGTPSKFYARPDGITLKEGRRFFENHGYAIMEERLTLMKLTRAERPMPASAPCRIACVGAKLQAVERRLVNERYSDMAFGARMIDQQLAQGARAFFAYSDAGVPVSMCLGEGYGSAFAITDIYTTQLHRGKGYATALVRAAGQYALAREFTDIFLYVADEAQEYMMGRLGFTGIPYIGYWAVKGGLPARMQREPGV